MAKRAAGYVRVSTAGQAEHGLGLGIQREAIAEYCKREGLELVGVYEDAGISGSNGVEDRIGWPELVDALEDREFSVVVVLRLDRLARDLMLQENMLATVQVLGGDLVSIDEPDLCNGDPTRTLFRHIKGAISEYEKAMIVARLRAGRRKKARQGGYPGGWVPYGYKLEGEGTEAAGCGRSGGGDHPADLHRIRAGLEHEADRGGPDCGRRFDGEGRQVGAGYHRDHRPECLLRGPGRAGWCGHAQWA